MGDSAASWISSNTEDKSLLPLQLFNEGYDIWLGTNRGATYSEAHLYNYSMILHRLTPDYTFADMGTQDMPAFLDQIFEETGQKATVIGYSQGASQMLYGLAQEKEKFSDKVEQFIALAPCLKMDMGGERSKAEIAEWFQQNVEQKGIQVLKSDIEGHQKIGCDLFDAYCPLQSADFTPVTMNQILYYAQLSYLPNQFESLLTEFIPLADWKSSDSAADSISLSLIDYLPVSIVGAGEDLLCTADVARDIFKQIGSEQKSIRFEQGSHSIFGGNCDQKFVQRMVETVEEGRQSSDKTKAEVSSKVEKSEEL